jgi:hypothetical protein
MPVEGKSWLRIENISDSDGHVLDLLPCPIGLWTRNFSRCHLNQPAKRLIHCAEADASRLSFFWLDHVHQADRERYLALRDQLTKRPSPISCDYRILRDDSNEPIWIREVSVLNEDQTASPWQVRSAYTEISDLKSSRYAKGDQREISAEVVEKVIHAVQNRLHVLSMGLELAGRGLNKQIEPRRFLEIVDSISRSVQDLRDYLVRIEGGLSAQDPAEILNAVLNRMRKELDRRSINLRLVQREPVPVVQADKEQLCSAFERIIEFCGAMLSRGGELKVEAGSKEVGGQIFAEFKVTTSPAACLEFVEGADSRPFMNLRVEKQGVGVNLAIAAEILRRYQGQVSFREASPQRGQLTVLIKSSCSGR